MGSRAAGWAQRRAVGRVVVDRAGVGPVDDARQGLIGRRSGGREQARDGKRAEQRGAEEARLHDEAIRGGWARLIMAGMAGRRC